jgi:hypothetical protein
MADVRVKLAAEGVAEVVGALRKVRSEADRTTQQSAKGFQGLRSVAADLSRLLPTLGAAAAVVGIARFAKSSIDATDALNDASKATGVSVESLSEYRFAAEQSGTSLDDLAQALRRLSIASVEASRGAEAPTETFDRLGISVTDANGKLKSSEQLLLEVAERFSRMEDGAEKAALGVALFGKSGTDLIPFLNQGAIGITELREQAQRLGLTLSRDAAEAADEFNDALNRLKSSVGGLGTAIATELAGPLSGLTDALTAVVSNDEIEALQASLRVQRGLITPSLTEGARRDLEATIARNELRLNELTAAADLRRFDDQAKRQAEARGQARAGSLGEVVVTGSRSGGGGAAQDPLAITVAAQRIQTSEMEQFYDRLDERTKTSTDRALDGYNEQKAALDELLAAGRIGVDQYNERLLAAIDATLQPFDVAAKRIEVTTEKASEFTLEAARGTQRIIADALANGFEGGARGIAQSFGNLLRDLAAQAVAAKLAEKLFGSIGAGGGSGTGGLFGAAVKALGFADGGLVQGPGTGTSDSILARLSAGEFVVPARAVARPGVLPALEALRTAVAPVPAPPSYLPRFAAGGLVAPPERSGLNVTQNFAFGAGSGSGMPLATQQQIGTEAMKGLVRAYRRGG